MFTIENSIKDGYNDVHHVLKKQIAERLGLNPYIFFNQVVLDHYYHINVIHANYSKRADKELANLYEELMLSFNHFVKDYDFKLTNQEYNNIKILYAYCTIKKWAKEYKLEMLDEIVSGYKKLEELSEMIGE